VKERPILFSTEMVRAILEGRKTQTRRVVKPRQVSLADAEAIDHVGNGEFVPVRNKRHGPFAFKCPYGQPGDILWVRETWAWGKRFSEDYALTLETIPKAKPEYAEIWYLADDGLERWKPSIHMPRWAARLFLTVKSVRIERLQEITEEDAKAEGAQPEIEIRSFEDADYCEKTGYRYAFSKLWDSINAKPRPVYEEGRIVSYVSYPWEDIQEMRTYMGKPWLLVGNPWVFVISFEVIGKDGRYA
jgi:hypothetical protein